MSTTAITTHIARKPHRCSWDNQLIAVGEEYKRYRSFEDGDAYTIKMHPECYAAMQTLPPMDSWYPGEMKRGSIEEP